MQKTNLEYHVSVRPLFPNPTRPVADASSLPEVRRSRVTEDVYDVLRRYILKQNFAVGERLDVKELARQLDVSRTPVREAIQRLEGEDLVKIVPRSGTYVRDVTAQDVNEVFELRYALEGHAVAQLAARPLSEDELETVREHATGPSEQRASGKRSEEEDDDRGIVEHAEANRSFHEELIALTGNRKLIQLYRTLNAHTMMAFIHYSQPAWEERRALEREEHAALLHALEEGDAAAAREAMEHHVERARRSLIEDVEQGET